MKVAEASNDDLLKNWKQSFYPITDCNGKLWIIYSSAMVWCDHHSHGDNSSSNDDCHNHEWPAVEYSTGSIVDTHITRGGYTTVNHSLSLSIPSFHVSPLTTWAFTQWYTIFVFSSHPSTLHFRVFLNKILYALPVYFGYLTEGHKDMLKRVLKRAYRMSFTLNFNFIIWMI